MEGYKEPLATLTMRMSDYVQSLPDPPPPSPSPPPPPPAPKAISDPPLHEQPGSEAREPHPPAPDADVPPPPMGDELPLDALEEAPLPSPSKRTSRATEEGGGGGPKRKKGALHIARVLSLLKNKNGL
jgi:hypothetical protein